MKTRQQAVDYGLTFKDTYMETPFRDTNWQLIRVKGSKKAFLWIYERNGFVNLNVKVDPQWRDFWRETYKSVIAGIRNIGILLFLMELYLIRKSKE